MKNLRYTRLFRRDLKRLKKAGQDLAELSQIIDQLAKGEKLATKYHDHPLRGNYQGYRECHVRPDWLLIYECSETDLILVRTGSHADFF